MLSPESLSLGPSLLWYSAGIMYTYIYMYICISIAYIYVYETMWFVVPSIVFIKATRAAPGLRFLKLCPHEPPWALVGPLGHCGLPKALVGPPWALVGLP